MVYKKEFVDAMASKFNVPKTVAGDAYDMFRDTLVDLISEGNDVAIMGFGTFNIKEVAEKMGRNPSTGEAVKIPKHGRLSFKRSNVMKDAVRGVY